MTIRNFNILWIIDYLKANEEDIWVAPLAEIVSYVGSFRKQAE